MNRDGTSYVSILLLDADAALRRFRELLPEVRRVGVYEQLGYLLDGARRFLDCARDELRGFQKTWWLDSLALDLVAAERRLEGERQKLADEISAGQRRE